MNVLDQRGRPGRAVRPSEVDAHRRGRYLAAVIVLVVVVDQASKWWAWRQTEWPLVNVGGNFLIGTTMSGWLSRSALGAALDLLGALALIAGMYVLARGRRGRATTIAGGLFLAGWISNLSDRLGLHEMTAPGSGRGVVDFIFIGTQTFNLADISIGAGTLGLLATAALVVARSWSDPVDARTLVEARRH